MFLNSLCKCNISSNGCFFAFCINKYNCFFAPDTSNAKLAVCAIEELCMPAKADSMLRIVILHFLCVSHWSAKNNPVSITTICLLFRLPAMQKFCWRQQMEKARRKGQKDWVWGGWGGWAGRGGCWKRATQTFSKTAGPFFSLCVSSDAHSWSFRLLGGGWETPTYTKQRSLLRCSKRGEGGLARGRDGWREVKWDVRKVIMSSLPEKCRCLSKWLPL